MYRGYDGGSFSGGFMSRTSNKKIKRVRDSIERFYFLPSVCGNYDFQVSSVMGVKSLTANQLKGDA